MNRNQLVTTYPNGPLNGDNCVHSRPVVVSDAASDPTSASTSVPRMPPSLRRAWPPLGRSRVGPTVLGGACPTSSVVFCSSSAVIASCLTHRAGARAGHHGGGSEVDHQGE